MFWRVPPRPNILIQSFCHVTFQLKSHIFERASCGLTQSLLCGPDYSISPSPSSLISVLARLKPKLPKLSPPLNNPNRRLPISLSPMSIQFLFHKSSRKTPPMKGLKLQCSSLNLHSRSMRTFQIAHSRSMRTLTISEIAAFLKREPAKVNPISWLESSTFLNLIAHNYWDVILGCLLWLHCHNWWCQAWGWVVLHCLQRLPDQAKPWSDNLALSKMPQWRCYCISQVRFSCHICFHPTMHIY